MNPLALFTGPYAMLARAAVIAVAAIALFGYGWFKGNEHGTAKLTDFIGKQAIETVRVAAAREKITTEVITKYVKVKGETEVITKTIDREVIKYAESNAGNCLDADWRVLHDRAANNTVPAATGGSDATGGAPPAATALATVTTNYAACHRSADRLDALQGWVREQALIK